SSRRRHTRSKRDWSSDVCSSDLRHAPEQKHRFYVVRVGVVIILDQAFDAGHALRRRHLVKQHCPAVTDEVLLQAIDLGWQIRRRSEERRVGKECRARGWGDEEKE